MAPTDASSPTPDQHNAGEALLRVASTIHDALNVKELLYDGWNRAQDFRTDSLIKRAQRLDTDPNDPELWKHMWWNYDNTAVFSAVVDGSVDVALQGNADGTIIGVEGPVKDDADKLLDVIRMHNLEMKLPEVWRSELVTGNGILLMDPTKNTILDSEPVPTETGSWKEIIKLDDGTRQYIRRVVDENGMETDSEPIPESRIIHQKMGTRAGLEWGIPQGRRVLRVIQGLQNAYEDIPVILKGFASPTRVATVNTELAAQAGLDVAWDDDNNTMSNTLNAMLENWQVNRHIGKPDWIELETLAYSITPVIIQLYHEMISQLLGVFRYPRHAFLPVNNRSISEQNEKMFQQRIRQYWAADSKRWEISYLWPLAIELGIPDPTKYTWKYLSPIENEKDLDVQATKWARLIAADVYTPMQVAEVGYAVSPEEYAEARGMTLGRGPDGTPFLQAPDQTTPGGLGGGGPATTDDPDNTLAGIAKDPDDGDPLPANSDEIDVDLKERVGKVLDFVERKARWHDYGDGIMKEDEEE